MVFLRNISAVPTYVVELEEESHHEQENLNRLEEATSELFSHECGTCLYGLGVPFLIIKSIVLRVISVVENIFSFPFLICSSDKCSNFKFRLFRLVLDPCLVLTEIVESILLIVVIIPPLRPYMFKNIQRIHAGVLSSYGWAARNSFNIQLDAQPLVAAQNAVG